MNKKQLLHTAMFSAAMLFSSSAVFAQVKIGTDPTTIETNSNLEVEASTTGRKIKVDKTSGQLTIKDGTEGSMKILTSDANGGASWQTLKQLKVPTTVFIGSTSASAVYPSSQSGAVTSRYNLVPSPGYTGYDVANRAYIIPEDGYYRVESGARAGLTTSTADIVLYLQGDLGISDTFSVDSTSTFARSFVQTQYYTAGQQVYGFLWYSGTGSASVTTAYMHITYIPN